jgi:hypothetical protein
MKKTSLNWIGKALGFCLILGSPLRAARPPPINLASAPPISPDRRELGADVLLPAWLSWTLRRALQDRIPIRRFSRRFLIKCFGKTRQCRIACGGPAGAPVPFLFGPTARLAGFQARSLLETCQPTYAARFCFSRSSAHFGSAGS